MDFNASRSNASNGFDLLACCEFYLIEGFLAIDAPNCDVARGILLRVGSDRLEVYLRRFHQVNAWGLFVNGQQLVPSAHL